MQTHKQALVSCEYCREAGWVVLRLPIVLTEQAKQKLKDFLFKEYWEYGTFQWTSNNSLRLIAKRGAKFLENLAILRQWAESAVKKLKTLQ